jgi:hypothetical protein
MTNKDREKENMNKSNVLDDDRGTFYEIHIKGHLDKSWAEWLGGLEIELLKNGEMLLSGHIADQAALMGILTKLYNLNLTLLSFNRINPEK